MNDKNPIIDNEDDSDPHEVHAKDIPCAVLQRLIEEVRCEIQHTIGKFNRTHNRHNRGR